MEPERDPCEACYSTNTTTNGRWFVASTPSLTLPAHTCEPSQPDRISVRLRPAAREALRATLHRMPWLDLTAAVNRAIINQACADFRTQPDDEEE